MKNRKSTLHILTKNTLIMNTLEKAEIKEVTREIMQEDKVFFKTILREIVEEPVQEVTPTETESGPANPGRKNRRDYPS